MYLLQNVAMGLSAVAAWLALALQHGPHPAWLFWTCVSLLIGLGSISSLGALGATVSVEKEWTKALCQGDANHLSQMNAGDRVTCCLSLCQLALPRTWALLMVVPMSMRPHMPIAGLLVISCKPCSPSVESILLSGYSTAALLNAAGP